MCDVATYERLICSAGQGLVEKKSLFVTNHLFYDDYYYIEYVIDDFLVGETADVSTVKGTSAEIAIPIEDIWKGLETGERVRIASFLFMNMTGLLPSSLEGAKDNNTRSVASSFKEKR